MRNINEIVKLVKSMETLETKTPYPNLTVCLVGKTGHGKTTRIEVLAKELGLRLIKLLPGTELPEEMLGYPRPVKTRGKQERIMALLRDELMQAIESPALLLIDELDKARDEVWGALLTLLASREIRGYKLHPETVVIAAMQPVAPEVFLSTETGEALAARLIFVPCNGDAREWIEKTRGVSLEKIDLSQEVPLPILPKPSPRQIDWGIGFIRAAARSGWDESEMLTVLKGVLQPHTAELLLEEVTKADIIDPWVLAEKDGKLLEIVQIVPVGELFERLSWLLTTDWPAGCLALERIATETDCESAASVIHNAIIEARKIVDDAGGILEVSPNLSQEQGAIIFEQTLRNIEKKWKERFEGV